MSPPLTNTCNTDDMLAALYCYHAALLAPSSPSEVDKQLKDESYPSLSEVLTSFVFFFFFFFKFIEL